MTQKPSSRRSLPLQVIASLVVLLLLGAGLLALVSFFKFKGSDVAWEFLRDLGIALVVAVVVAGLFELYRSIRHNVETMRDVLDITMNDKVTPEVWQELRTFIEARKVIRRNMHVRWCLVKEASLPEHLAVLQIEIGYELHALSSSIREVLVEHELDYHMANQTLNLPRFDRILINPDQCSANCYSAEEIAQKWPRGKVSISVPISRGNARPTIVRTERQELVNVPGSYNLYTPELVKSFDVYYGDCLATVEPEVLVRPFGYGVTLKHVGNNWSCEDLLLPGHGIEIKLRLKAPI